MADDVMATINRLLDKIERIEKENRELRDRLNGEPARSTLPIDDATLTEREIEVGRGILIGKHRAEIAEDLGVALDTVKSHADNIYKKLGINNRRELRLHKRLFEADKDEP